MFKQWPVILFEVHNFADIVDVDIIKPSADMDGDTESLNLAIIILFFKISSKHWIETCLFNI